MSAVLWSFVLRVNMKFVLCIESISYILKKIPICPFYVFVNIDDYDFLAFLKLFVWFCS